MRNTTVRTFGAAAAALALSAGLVACGDDKGETTTTETSVVETEATETNVETNTVTRPRTLTLPAPTLRARPSRLRPRTARRCWSRLS